MTQRINDFITPLLLGGLATLGFAPFGWYGLALLALAGLVALWWQAGPARAAWRGWLFGLANFGSGIYWIYISAYHFGGAPQAVAVFLPVLLSIVLALFIAATGAVAGFTRHLPRTLWALLVVPAAWLFFELLRSRIGTGFPWLSMGYTLTGSPLTMLPPVIGVYGLSALMVAGAGALALLLAGSICARLTVVVLAALLPVVLWGLPPASHWTQPAGQPIRVAIVQGDIPQGLKWKPGMLNPTKRAYRDLTESTSARLVVWPEMSIPALKQRVQGYLDSLDADLAAHDQTVLVGVLEEKNRNAPLYNTVVALGAGHGYYYKRHLVPFGEYFPVPDFLLPLLKGIHMQFSNFTPGPQKQQPIVVDGVTLGLSICFEDAFDYEIRKALPAAGILVNVTNDAWFVDSTETDQHFQISRMRAMESGRPMVRASNTGESAFIGPTGRVLEKIPYGQRKVIEMDIQPHSGETPYTRYGDMPLWIVSVIICLLGLGGATFLTRRSL